MNKELYYRPLRAGVDVVALVKALLVGIVAAVPLALIYDYAIIYIPVIYVNALSVVGFAFVLGWVVSKIFYRSKMRHTTGAMVLGLVVGIVAWYVSWVVWVSIQFSSEIFPAVSTVLGYLFSPGELWQRVLQINASGTRGIGSGSSVRGVMLWVVWAIEALIIWIGTMLFSAQDLDKPFSEEDDDRYKEKKLTTKFAPVTKERDDADRLAAELAEVVDRLESGDFSVFEASDESHDGGEHSTVVLYHDAMRKSFYMTVTEHRLMPGKDDLSEVTIVEYLTLSPEQAQDLMG